MQSFISLFDELSVFIFKIQPQAQIKIFDSKVLHFSIFDSKFGQ